MSLYHDIVIEPMIWCTRVANVTMPSTVAYKLQQ